MAELNRLVLSDEMWERMMPLIIGRADQRGKTGRDNRMFVEAVLWVVRTGAAWRALPGEFDTWNNVFRRFSRWSEKGVWRRVIEAMSDEPGFDYKIINSSIIYTRQPAAGIRKGGLKIRPLDAPSMVSTEIRVS